MAAHVRQISADGVLWMGAWVILLHEGFCGDIALNLWLSLLAGPARFVARSPLEWSSGIIRNYQTLYFAESRFSHL